MPQMEALVFYLIILLVGIGMALFSILYLTCYPMAKEEGKQTQKNFLEKCKDAFSFSGDLLKIAFLSFNLLIFVVLSFAMQDLFWVLKHGIILSLLGLVAYVDFKIKEIPNMPVIALGALGIFLNLWYWDFNYSFNAMLTLGLFGGLFVLTYFIAKGALGMGDVKLLTVLAFLQELGHTISLFTVTFVLGALLGLVLFFAFKKDGKYKIPFAPVLFCGYSVSMIFNFL